MEKYNLKKIKQSLEKPWAPVEIARFNNQVLRMAMFEGEYHWHTHEKEDEFFLVYKGSIIIETENGSILLSEGEGSIIPRGLKHKPSARVKSFVLMLEPASLKSEGD